MVKEWERLADTIFSENGSGSGVDNAGVDNGGDASDANATTKQRSQSGDQEDGFTSEGLTDNHIQHGTDADEYTTDMDENTFVPQDLHDLDRYALRTLHKNALSSARRNVHGLAKFRLNDLLSLSQEVAYAFSRNSAEDPEQDNRLIRSRTVRMNATSLVIPMKRLDRMSPDEEQQAWDLTDSERLVRKTAAYMVRGTEMTLQATLARPLRSIIETYKELTADVPGIGVDESKEGQSTSAQIDCTGRLTEAGTLVRDLEGKHYTDVAYGRRAVKGAKFERAILIFPYKNKELLKTVQQTM